MRSTYDYARAALWDTAIKFSLQSRAMTSPDHLALVHAFVHDKYSPACLVSQKLDQKVKEFRVLPQIASSRLI